MRAPGARLAVSLPGTKVIELARSAFAIVVTPSNAPNSR